MYVRFNVLISVLATPCRNLSIYVWHITTYFKIFKLVKSLKLCEQNISRLSKFNQYVLSGVSKDKRLEVELYSSRVHLAQGSLVISLSLCLKYYWHFYYCATISTLRNSPLVSTKWHELLPWYSHIKFLMKFMASQLKWQRLHHNKHLLVFYRLVIS